MPSCSRDQEHYTTHTTKKATYPSIGRRVREYKRVLKTLTGNQNPPLQDHPPAPDPKTSNPLVLRFMVDQQEVINLFESIQYRGTYILLHISIMYCTYCTVALLCIFCRHKKKTIFITPLQEVLFLKFDKALIRDSTRHEPFMGISTSM